MWVYFVKFATYGEDDVTTLLRNTELQNGLLTIEKIFPDTFEKNKILTITWSLEDPSIDCPKSVISARIGTQHLRDKNFTAKYTHMKDVILHPICSPSNFFKEPVKQHPLMNPPNQLCGG